MNKKRHVEFKIEKGKLYKAERGPLPRVNRGECPFCGIPVYVSEGQLLIYRGGQPTHKICRKEHDNRRY